MKMMGMHMNIVRSEEPQLKELKKHVGTIQCSNSLSLIQRKVSNALLFHAYNRLLTEEEHTIEIRELCQIIGYASHDHKLIKDALRKLLSTVLEWNVLREENESCEEVWTASSILASVSIDRSTCKFAYSPRMKSLMFMPSMYGRIDMLTQTKFKSTYALALYENCVRYQDLPYTGWMKIEIFRKLMGVAEDKYKIFRDFKKRIIDKAIEEVNLYSNLKVSPEVRREKRKVTMIRFKIEKKLNSAKKEKNEEENNRNVFSENQDDKLLKLLMEEFHFNVKQAKYILKTYENDYIESKIGLIKDSKSFKSNRILNLASYLTKALVDDFKENSVGGENKKTSKHRCISALVDDQECSAEHKASYHRYVVKQIDEKLSLIKYSEKQKIEKEFVTYLQSLNADFIWKYYQRDGLDNRAVRGEFHHFLRENYSHLLNSIKDIKVFTDKSQGAEI